MGGNKVSFASNGGQAHGYLALPSAGRGPGVVVIQEWWGLTDHIAEVTERLADAGFVALAPDLYGGRTTHDSKEAAKWMHELPVADAARDLAGAVDYLLDHDVVTGESVGVLGFCMGGGFVLVLAAQQGDRIGAAVPFYGLPPLETDFAALTAPVLGHFGEHDRTISPEAVEQVGDRIRAQSGVEAQTFFYPAGHAFFNNRNPTSHQQDSAELAWERTLEFLRANLS